MKRKVLWVKGFVRRCLSNLKLHFLPSVYQISHEIRPKWSFLHISRLILHNKGGKCSFRLQKVVKPKNMFSKIQTRGDHLFNALSIAFIRQLEPKIDTLKKCGTGMLYFPPPKKTLKWCLNVDQMLIFKFFIKNRYVLHQKPLNNIKNSLR